jgi:oligopeptide/dipeptide ABC transporter ATP-binding protein
MMDDGTAPAVFALPAQALLDVRGLCKTYTSAGKRDGTASLVRAVEDVTLSIADGETLGIVGESGSGKTTLARCLMRAVEPTIGTVRFRRRDGRTVEMSSLAPRELRALRGEMQMIFQDPQSSLDPRMTVGEIVAEPLRIHHLHPRSEIRDRVAAMLERVGLRPEHMERYPSAFSTGQRQRIGIARALILRPSLVIADEPVSTLDVSVQAQVLNLLKELQREFRLTLLFVAHNLDVVRHFCDRVAVMYAGRIVEMADSSEIFAYPKHPYTQALLAAAPSADPDQAIRQIPAGEAADLGKLPPGCAFYARCPARLARCSAERPRLQRVASGVDLACHLHAQPSLR